MTDLLALAFSGVGVVAILVGVGFERFHSREFDRHIERLEAADDGDDDAAIEDELLRFHNDDRVDWAIRLILPAYLTGVSFQIVAVLVYFA